MFTFNVKYKDMITQVLMKRELFGSEITQQSKTEFFSATDMVRSGNKYRRENGMIDFNMSQWLNTKGPKEFIAELEVKYGKCVKRSNRTTWVHPLLFIDMALAMSPQLKIEVYEWLFDHLIKYRNDSGDSYKEMAGALYTRFNNNKEFPRFIAGVADQIRDSCQVKDWEHAHENQLRMRSNIHNSIKTLCRVLDNPKEAVRIGIAENMNN